MAVEIYLELAGKKTGPVLGEAKSKECQNQIEVTKVSFGAVSPEDYATKKASGKVRLDDLEFDTPVSLATPGLMAMIMGNEATSKCIFRYRKASGTSQTTGATATYVFMVLTITKARITALKQSTEGEKQMMNVKIGYTKMVFDYYMQKQDGSIEKSPHTVTYDGDLGEGGSATGE